MRVMDANRVKSNAMGNYHVAIVQADNGQRRVIIRRNDGGDLQVGGFQRASTKAFEGGR